MKLELLEKFIIRNCGSEGLIADEDGYIDWYLIGHMLSADIPYKTFVNEEKKWHSDRYNYYEKLGYDCDAYDYIDKAELAVINEYENGAKFDIIDNISMKIDEYLEEIEVCHTK